MVSGQPTRVHMTRKGLSRARHPHCASALFLLPLVGSHQLDVLDEMALHRLLELRLGGILQILKRDIKRIKLEEIAMSTHGGTRAAVGLLSEIVGAMPR